MTKITSLSVAGALLACGLSAAPAHAFALRIFVSGKGTNSGACTRAAPCKTFAFALTQTFNHGEIDVLDPADYGPVTINQAISIVNDGVGTAGILQASAGSAITLVAGASDSVHLRGLTIEGLGAGSSGISFNTGGNLAIENCVIRDFTGAGIAIQPTGSAVVTGVLSTVIASNNSFGIIVSGSASTGGSVNVTVVDSALSNNANTGILAASVAGRAATAVMLRNSVASYNRVIGLVASNASIRVGHSVVIGSPTGVSVEGLGTLFSYGDNDINGNANNNTGVLSVIPTR